MIVGVCSRKTGNHGSYRRTTTKIFWNSIYPNLLKLFREQWGLLKSLGELLNTNYDIDY
jgi:hypothetical protein